MVDEADSIVTGRMAQDARTLVVGMGVTGLSCVRYLLGRGESVSVADSRTAPPALDEISRLLPGEAIHCGGFDETLFAGFDRLIVSPGVPLETAAIEAARRAGAVIMGDIELFAASARAPVVAITGSNGKTTVTTLLSQMAERAGRQVRTGGNIGVAALDLLEGEVPDLYVLELSSFQLDTTMRLAAAVAVVLNISPDHLDRHADMAAYRAAKLRVYSGAGIMVVNRDDAGLQEVLDEARAGGRKMMTFGMQAPDGDEDFGLLNIDGREMIAQGHTPLLDVAELKMVGRHNIANVLAALTLGSACGLGRDAMVAAARDFPGLPHRVQWIAESRGVRWFNDSKGTNVGATAAAIEGMPGKVVLIAGGQGKGADFTALREPLAHRGRAAVLIGEDADLIASAVADVVTVSRASDMPEAVARADELAQAGDCVLLSPACASFDMFSGYEARGEAFVCAVKERLS